MRIHDAQSNAIFSGAEIRRDVELKRRVTAAIVADFAAIDPKGTLIIDGAKMQKNIHTQPVRRNGDATGVPDDGMNGFIVDAGERALIGKRNEDAGIERDA